MVNKVYTKRKNDDRKGAGIWRLFGPVLVVLLFIIVVTLFNFSVSSNEEAKVDIINQLTDSTKIQVHQASLDINRIMAAGSVAAGMLSDNGTDFNHWKENIGYINNSIDNIYMVSIVNLNGKGICSSKDETIDISEHGYYMELAIPYVTVTQNDGITGESAVVCVIPLKEEGKLFGYINHYIDFRNFQKLFSLEGNDRSNGFMLINKNGQILLSNGVVSNFENTSFYDLLYSSTVKGKQTEEIKSNIDVNVTQNFTMNKDGKDYLVITTPTEVNNWVFVNVIGDGYYQNLLKQKMSNEKILVERLIIVSFVTILLVVIVVTVNKAKDAQANKALENRADTDLLTGLNNKIATERKIAECLENEKDEQHLMLLFDVDNFKKINDTMGHAFGDTVLKTLGEQLTQEFRKTDILGRLGGDEFAILLRDIKTDDILIKECDKILEFFNQFKAGDYVKYSATASIGAAVYPRDGKSFEDLYKSADSALYESKKRGKNRLTYANKELAKYKEDKEKANKEAALEQ